MNKLIQSPWVIAILAGVLYFISTGGALFLTMPRWMPVPPEPEIPERHPYELESMLGFNSQAMEELALELEARTEIMDAREKNLDARAELLEDERNQLEVARAKIEQQEERLRSLIFTYKATEATQLKRLVGIYSQMEPTLIVEVLNEFNEDKVVKILQMMNQELVKDIFETMLAGERPEEEQALRVAYLSQQLTRTFPEEAFRDNPRED